METRKILNLLNSPDNEYSKFATKNWYVIDNESKSGYSHEDPIKFLTKLIESSLCDYFDAYILVTGNITVTQTVSVLLVFLLVLKLKENNHLLQLHK